MRLAELAAEAEKIAAAVELPPGKRFETLRRLVREAISPTETGKAIEAEVEALLPPSGATEAVSAAGGAP